jgi:predicted MFS family arabinose efflux permease
MATKTDTGKAAQSEDPHYVGNIWGWRFSYFSLILILAMLALMLYRYAQLPPDQRKFQETDEQPLLPWEKPKKD